MEIKQFRVEDLRLSGMVMIVIEPEDAEGNFRLVEYGVGFVPTSPGISMVIEEKYINQIEKFKLQMNNMFQPTLVLKDGETFEKPAESADVVRARELEEELQAIRERQALVDTVPAEELKKL